MEMTTERWAYTTQYLKDTFGGCDPHLSSLMEEAVKAGLPDIAVSADVGRLLQILVSMTQGRLVVELGTLAGYSTIWLARGLSAKGRLITVEPNDKHADFAQAQFTRAGLDDRIELVRSGGIEALESLAQTQPPGSVDVLFLDAVKTEYPEYFRIARPLIAPGGLLIADNILGSSHWWIDQEGEPNREATDLLSRTVAADPEFEAAAVPIREGVLIAKRLKV